MRAREEEEGKREKGREVVRLALMPMRRPLSASEKRTRSEEEEEEEEDERGGAGGERHSTASVVALYVAATCTLPNTHVSTHVPFLYVLFARHANGDAAASFAKLEPVALVCCANEPANFDVVVYAVFAVTSSVERANTRTIVPPAHSPTFGEMQIADGSGQKRRERREEEEASERGGKVPWRLAVSFMYWS